MVRFGFPPPGTVSFEPQARQASRTRTAVGKVVVVKVFNNCGHAQNCETEFNKYQRPQADNLFDLVEEMQASRLNSGAPGEVLDLRDLQSVEDGERHQRCANHLDGGGIGGTSLRGTRLAATAQHTGHTGVIVDVAGDPESLRSRSTGLTLCVKSW